MCIFETRSFMKVFFLGFLRPRIIMWGRDKTTHVTSTNTFLKRRVLQNLIQKAFSSREWY